MLNILCPCKHNTLAHMVQREVLNSEVPDFYQLSWHVVFSSQKSFSLCTLPLATATVVQTFIQPVPLISQRGW